MSSATRSNGRPALPLSSLYALDLDLPSTGSAWLVCPDCRHWCEVVRGLVQTHRPAGHRCPGSAQRIEFDLTPAQHTVLRTAAREHLRSRGKSHPAHPVLREGQRRAVRRIATHAVGQHVEGEARAAVATALDAGWEGIARIPAAPSAHQIAAQRAGASVHPAQVTGHGWPEFWLTRTEMEHANSASTVRRAA